MNNWSRTSPLITGLQALRAGEQMPSYDGWSVDELLLGERLAQAMPTTSPLAASPTGEPAGPELPHPQPAWVANAQWRATPEVGPWPEAPSSLSPIISEDPFERAAIRMRRSVVSDARRRSPMGPPFLDEPPQNYPSHLGPVPQAPRWEQTVTGATPWSPFARPPGARDWGKTLTGIECRRTNDGQYINCITPGGRRVSVPAEGFPEYIGPGQPNYHYYNVPVGPVAEEASSIRQGVIERPTPGPSGGVRPASVRGTPNEATPPIGYHTLVGLAQAAGPFGQPVMPPFTDIARVRSYLTTDQTGAQVIVNVTEPGHPLYPGLVIRYVTESPRGATIQNEGTGLGKLQAPGGFLSDRINTVWNGQSRAIIEDQIRRQRR